MQVTLLRIVNTAKSIMHVINLQRYSDFKMNTKLKKCNWTHPNARGSEWG